MKTKIEKPLNSIYGVNIGLPASEAAVMPFTAENVIGLYEKEAREVLRRDGYPLTIEELWERKDELLPDLANGRGLSQVYSIFWMLWHLNRVRAHIKENNTDQAVCCMAVAVHESIRAKLKSVEHLVDMTEKHRQDQQQKRQKRQRWHGLTRDQRTLRDKNIIDHYRKASRAGKITLHGFAKKYEEKYGLKPTRIKEIIRASLDA